MSSSGNDESIAKRWRELHGEHSWDRLLDPLDIDLRKFIISYGELASATYLGFNSDKRSPHAGACLYGRSDLLTSTDVATAGHYEVTKFVYATSGVDSVRDAFLVMPDAVLEGAWSRETNWMGYIAVATDEGVAALGRRDIVVAWRGTSTMLEAKNDFDHLWPVSAKPLLGHAESAHPSAKVHRGFMSLYMSSNPESKYNKTSARDQVLGEVSRLVEKYKDEEKSITITGHSLGAALATINAVDIVGNCTNIPISSSSQPPCPVTAIVFASPRVGEQYFKQAFDSFHDQRLRALHVKDAKDPVPQFPWLYLVGEYVDVPVTLPINTALSPYLKDNQKTGTFHNLDLYLHGVDGDQGSAGGFKLEVGRDLALVNRSADVLKDKYPVPVSWWGPKNKFMVKNTQGKWELHDFEEI